MTFAPDTAWSNLYLGTKSPKLFSILVSSDITEQSFADEVLISRPRPEYYHIGTDIPISGNISPGIEVYQQGFCGKNNGSSNNCYWYMGNSCYNIIPVTFTSPLVSGIQTVDGYYPIPNDPANTQESYANNFYAYIKSNTNAATPSTVKSGDATYGAGIAYKNTPVNKGQTFFVQNGSDRVYMTGALSVNYAVDVSSPSFQLYEGDLNLVNWMKDVSNSEHMHDIVKTYLKNSVYISSILTEFYNQLYFQGFYSNGANPWMYFSQTNPMTDPTGVINNFTKQYISTLNIPNMTMQNSVINNMMIIPEINISNDQCSIKMFIPINFDISGGWEQSCEKLMNSILQDSKAKYSYKGVTYPSDFSLKLSITEGEGPFVQAINIKTGEILTSKNGMPKDDYTFTNTPFQQITPTNGPWWPGPNCKPEAEYFVPFTLGYIVSVNVVKWTPMLALYVANRYTNYNYTTQLCSNIANDIVTYPKQCLKPGSDYTKTLINLCGFNIQLPPVYTKNLDMLNNLINTRSDSCGCFQSLLAPPGQNNMPNGIAVNRCFSSKCSQNIRDDSYPPFTEPECKKYCGIVWDWLNSQPPFESVKPDDIDWNRLEQVCGKKFRPYNVPFFNKEVLITGLIIVVAVVILVIMILKNHH